MKEEEYRINMYQSLIVSLIDELKDQNIEIVCLRRLLSDYMSYPGNEYLKTEILSNLYPINASDRKDYDYVLKTLYKGKDPFYKDKEYSRKLKKAAKGIISEEHPQICLDYLK